jgi:hypothetical protein
MAVPVMGTHGSDSASTRVLQPDISATGRRPAVIGIEPWSWRGDDNSGNMIHAAAARRILSEFIEYKNASEWSDSQIDRLRSEASHLVYVTANLIRLGVPSNHPSIKELVKSQVILAKNIERANLPVVVFGIGCQAQLNGPYEYDVAPETVRLLKILADHSKSIAVRGAFTADACTRIGIKNIEITGCQSMFWYRSPQVDWIRLEPDREQLGKIACNFTDARAEAKLIQQAMACGYDVIGQGNGAEADVNEQNSDNSPMANVKFGWDVELAFNEGLIDRQQYEHWIRNHFYQFRRPEAWLDHMRRYCFSYGTRLHGNMVAMIAGTRALWIVHDMRTKEVCDYFNLPSVLLHGVRNGLDYQMLAERADYSECIKVYPKRYRALFDYVERSGLPHLLPPPITTNA